MPFGIKPVCSACKVTTSTLWRKNVHGEILCNSCGIKHTNNSEKESSSNGNTVIVSKNENCNHVSVTAIRKSARIKTGKNKFQSSTKALSTKGKGRRIVFKRNQPIKAPNAIATVVTGDSVFHDGQYYQIGDIVSLVDHDGDVYYAQIRGLMCDQYYEKSAVITWLLPTQGSHQYGFDASTYILGPEEDIPRKMEFMQFVCHAPSGYYHDRSAPYPVEHDDPNLCFIWTSLGPEIQTKPSLDEIFGVQDDNGCDTNDHVTTSDISTSQSESAHL